MNSTSLDNLLRNQDDSHFDGKSLKCSHSSKTHTGKKHLKTQTDEKPFACTQCSMTFRRSGHLKNHTRTHTGEKPFACTHCSMRFADSSNLKTHIRTHTGEKPFACTHCSMTFTHSSNLGNHIRTHIGVKPFACTHCSMRFIQSVNLANHIRTHSGDKPFACTYCSMKFSQSSSLKHHIRTHTGEKPFACTYCGMKFHQSSNLKKHLRTHTGEKPFACTYCSIRFTDSSSLKYHIRTHTGEKPFTCTYCSMRFPRSSDLKRHFRTHAGDKPFACTYCSMRYTRLSNLKSHIARVHSVETDQDNNSGSASPDSVDENSIQNEKQESSIPELNNGSSPLDCEVNVTLMNDCKEDDSDYKQTFKNYEALPLVHSEQKDSISSGGSEDSKPTEFSVNSASTIISPSPKVKEETMNELKSEPEYDLIQLIKTEEPEHQTQENDHFKDYKYRQLEQCGDWKLMVSPRVELFLLNLPMLSSVHLYV